MAVNRDNIPEYSRGTCVMAAQSRPALAVPTLTSPEWIEKPCRNDNDDREG
jgi:hypothetical protein